MTPSNHIPTVTHGTPPRLVLIPGAHDAAGEPRIALEVPPQPGAFPRRPTLQMFASVAAALSAKRSLEAG
jgi:hypothetical protein